MKEEEVKNESDLTTHSASSDIGVAMTTVSQADMEEGAKRQDKNALPYITASSCTPIGVVVPTKISYETVQSLNTFIINDIDTTNFVKNKLNYNSRVAVCDAFASEQVDALALAITQIEKGKGFILGDMAGTGKGRVVAGICRYALQHNKIPVFMTISANLFSDIYRDFKDIGGVDSSNKIPTPFIFNTDGKIEEIGPSGDLVTKFAPLTTKKTVEICNLGEMPQGRDIIMSTYSQFSVDINDEKNTNGISKFEFLCKIAPNCIFVLDESHKGAGEGNVGLNIKNILANASGVMFASATYSKVPKSLMLYIPYTDIVDSSIRPKTIVDAVRDNGEIVQEYIAGLLVKSGQMIRRQRTLDGCEVNYEYISLTKKDYYYAMYDGLMSLYNEIEKFSTSALYGEARWSAVERYAKAENVEILPFGTKKPTSKEEKRQWESDNAKKYFVEFPTTNSLKGRFQWIENLLFSLKADFVAEQIIKLLQTQKEAEYIEDNKKSMVMTNKKPVVALRNTGESAMKLLGYKNGQKLTKEENDYAKTLIHIADALITATLTFKPVNKQRNKIIIEDAKIEDADFTDKGLKYEDLRYKLSNAVSGIPLSPIDDIISKVESALRPQWDKKYTDNKHYVVEEITKRSLNIKKISDNEFEVVIPSKRTIVEKVKSFNNGTSDVIIINTAGSTGLSIHSNAKFVDRRPRVMLIQQVELDVATEVQKWGRINRTGQVNLPAYTYIVSPIPAEIRKLMMLRKKLRSLDANTSGNAKQSAKQSEILDKKGNPIEDMTNKYGYQVLTDFLDEPSNSKFRDIQSEEWYDKNASSTEKFESYLRALERMSCDDQEYFYDTMNVAYLRKKEEQIKKDEWDIDVDIEDLKSATHNKRLLYLGDDSNEFTKSVYIEDKFVESKGKPYSKEELFEAINKLCEGKRRDIWFTDMIDEFDQYSDTTITEIRESFGEVDLSNATTKEQEKEEIEKHNTKIATAIDFANVKLKETRNFLIYYRPNTPIAVPKYDDELADGWQDEKRRRKSIPYYFAKVIGIKFLSKSENKFSPMNIQIQIATMSKIKAKIEVTLTKQYQNFLYWVKETSLNLTPKELEDIDEWQIPKTQDREMMRVLTGEIFRAFELSKNIISAEKDIYSGKKRLIKYTTANGGTESAVRLWTDIEVLLSEGRSNSYLELKNIDFVRFLTTTKFEKDDTKKAKTVMLSLGSDFNQFFKIEYTSDSASPNQIYLGYFSGFTKARKTPIKERVSSLNEYMGYELERMFGVKREDSFMPIYQEVKNLQVFMYNLTYVSEDALSKAFQYIFGQTKWVVEIKSDIDFDVLKAQDFKGEVEKAGEYFYYLTSPFNEDNTPSNYIKGSYKPTKENRYGMVTLSFPVPLIYRPQNNVVPADLTELEGVRSILNQINNDTKKKKYIEDVKSAQDYIDVVEITEKLLGFSPIFALGNVDNFDAGRIISENIEGASKNESKESKKVEATTKVETTKIPLDWETAQDFIIKLKSL